MFHLSGVSVSYGSTRALDTIDVTIKPGELVCLIGPSGAGKSTFLGLLNGRVTASAGEVLVEDQPIAALHGQALRSLRSRIAWVPQNLGLVPSLRANQNIACGRAANKGTLGILRSLLVMSRAEKEEIHTLLQRVGIPEKLFARTDQLSGGQRQRVAIARALFQNPKAILADEPVSSVDPARAKDLVTLLTTLTKESGLTLVMSLHDITLARSHFDRIIGLRDGKIAFDGQPAESDIQEVYNISPSQTQG